MAPPADCVYSLLGHAHHHCFASVRQTARSNEHNLLAFVGYQDEGAPGKRFLDLTERGGEVKLPTGPNNSFEAVPVYCRVGAFSFSGHADAGALMSLGKRYSPKRVVLVHGEGGSR